MLIYVQYYICLITISNKFEKHQTKYFFFKNMSKNIEVVKEIYFKIKTFRANNEHIRSGRLAGRGSFDVLTLPKVSLSQFKSV